MKPVYQKPMDGQCMRACIATMFDIPMEGAPRVQCEGHIWDEESKSFVCTVPEHKKVRKWNDGDKLVESVHYECDSSINQDKLIQDWAGQFGLRFVHMWMDHYGREAGARRTGDYHLLPPGICIASGRSPRFGGNHAVVWDTRLKTFEQPYGQMVHDPAPVPEGTRPGILEVDEFSWFEVEDPSLLHKLGALY